ncbi:MAG: sterol desaturase family protein [Cytophagaceae bacterium]|jgi:beta-carotene 3-hydroxylase|nr:sterol desaturase family protein [Cytophagaceae bacterium]
MTPLHILTFILAFFGMEFVAWFSHKYIMHGFLWHLHEDHHSENHKLFQKNDYFILIFAIPSWLTIMLGMMYQNQYSVITGIGIAVYGFVYFVLHEIFIHQRFKFLRKLDHWYFKGIRRAHKIHHKTIGKEGSSCFGMLIVPLKYFKEAKEEGKLSTSR